MLQILNLRLREAEQQRLREVELERQRQVEGRERHRAINAIQEEVLQLNQLLQPRPSTHTDLALDHTPYITRGNQLCSQVSEVVPASADVSPHPPHFTIIYGILKEGSSAHQGYIYLIKFTVKTVKLLRF